MKALGIFTLSDHKNELSYLLVLAWIFDFWVSLLSVLWYTDADMEDYGFEYSDEEPEEQDVDIENQYYNSKGKDFIWRYTIFLFDSYLQCIVLSTLSAWENSKHFKQLQW